ncbi:CopG family ribbon-helix-helix protein [Brevundimonas sp. TWP2-3-2]|uniref:CopG family ribbon-helix-helix protein n=1 Tax=unclassified Brevundimonas TaxID=2622653 RepID=UPI003CF7AA72
MTVHVTIEMDEAVKAKLDAFSSARGRAAGELLVEAAELIAREHDALEAAIVEAEASLAAGKGIPHEEVVARLHARRARWTDAA